MTPGTYCYFGRGALQITWPGNYQLVSALVKAVDPSIDLCENPDRLCSDPKIAWLTAVAYWTASPPPEVPTYVAHDRRTPS